MKLSLWRPRYLAYLQPIIKVDTWGIDKPMKDVVFSSGYNFDANSLGYLPSLREVSYTYDETARYVVGSAIQDLYVLARLDKATPFHSLPIAKLEGLQATFSIITSLNYKQIVPDNLTNSRGLLSWQWIPVSPVSIAPSGEFNSDYIAEVVWSARFTFIADPESGILPRPYNISSIGLNLRRSALADFQDNILDFSSIITEDTN